MTRRLVIAGSLLTALLLGVVWRAWLPGAPPLQPPLALNLGLALQPSSALAIIADAQDYYAAEGLQASLRTFPSGRRALDEGLISGTVDVSTASDIPLAVAAMNRQPVRVLAELWSAGNVNRIVARRDRGIATLRDLKGKNLATQRDSAVHYFLHLVLRDQGWSAQDVTLHFMQAEALPRALADGQIDAFSMREPFVSQAVQLLGDNAVVLAAPQLYRQSEVLIANAAWLQRSPDAAIRLLRALLRAEIFARDHPGAAMDILARSMNVSLDAISAQIEAYRLQLALPQSLLLALEQEADWLLARSAPAAAGVPNFLDYIAPQALEQVKPDAVTYLH